MHICKICTRDFADGGGRRRPAAAAAAWPAAGGGPLSESGRHDRPSAAWALAVTGCLGLWSLVLQLS